MTWSCTNCMPWIRLRMRLALRRHLDAQGVLHRAARRDGVHHGAHAADALGEGPGVARVAPLQDDLDARGTGSDEAQAFVIFPSSACTSMRRCPSMRVMGSTTTFPGHGRTSSRKPMPSGCGRGRPGPSGAARSCGALLRCRSAGRRWRRRAPPRPPRPPSGQRGADQVGVALHAEAGHVGQPLVERRHGVPEVPLRCSRCRGAPRRWASWCWSFHCKIGQARRPPAPCTPPCRGTSPCGRASSSKASTNCPASKWARRQHSSWMRVP